jgi:hypothetical protein
MVRFAVIDLESSALDTTTSGEEPPVDGNVGSEVGIEEYRKNLIGISLEFHENFKETPCISDIYCIQ